MSFNDPAETPDVAQPEGQDDGGTRGDSPYADYLNRIPEDAREAVEPVFKDWDANTTRKFQEHAEFRKQWEPYQETGVKDLSPDQLSYAVQLFNALEQPDVMKEWWEGYAQQNGLTPAEAKAAEEAAVDDFGFQDPSQQFEKLLEERLGPLTKQLEQYDNRFQQQEKQQAEAEAGKFIQGQIGELKKEHGDFDKETEEFINTLAGRYIETDPMNAIPRAFADLQKLRNDVEKSALQGKVNQPAPAEGGGVPDVAIPEHKRIDSEGVRSAALEWMRNTNRA